MLIDQKGVKQKYSIKFSYNWLNKCQNVKRIDLWKKAQPKKLIAKISFLLWVVVLNRIYINDNLRNKGVIFPIWCVLCRNEEEFMKHLLIHIELSYMICDEILKMIDIQQIKSRSLVKFIEYWDISFVIRKLKVNKHMLALHI